MEIIKKVFAKVGTFAAGRAMFSAINYPFDYVLYPAVILWLGSIIGGVVMTILSIILNLFIMRLYDWSQVDWFYLETLKSHHDDGNSGRIWRLIRKSKPVVFLLLCWDDPVFAAIYGRRKGFRNSGFTAHDWKIFLLANVIANFYWIVGISAVIWLWEIIFN